MLNLIAIVALLLALVTAEKSDVIILDASNFQSELDKHGSLLVKFYAPWCGHCQALEPTWNELAGTIEGTGVGKIDCTTDENRPICGEYKIRGFPTLILLEKSGARITHKGSRTADVIKEFVKSNLGSTVREFDLQSYKQNPIRFILMKSNPETMGKFEEIATPLKGQYFFSHTTDTKFEYHEVDTPTLLVSKDGEPDQLIPFTESAARDAINSNLRLLVSKLGPDNFSDFSSDEKAHFWILFIDPNNDEHMEQVSALREVAKKFRKEKINFTYIDGVQFAGFLKNFDEEAKLPQTLVLDSPNTRFFKVGTDFEMEVIKLLAGTLEATPINPPKK